MKKHFIFISTALLCLLLLIIGCQSEDDVMMDDASDIKSISISKAKVYGKITNELPVIFEQEQQLDRFRNAFTTAKREKEKLAGINYDLIIDDRYLLQFYLGEKGGKSAFFYIGYEDKVYYTSEEVTLELREIINPSIRDQTW